MKQEQEQIVLKIFDVAPSENLMFIKPTKEAYEIL